MIIYALMLITGVAIGYGIGLCKMLQELDNHCQELLDLNETWFKHLENHTDAMYRMEDILNHDNK